MSSADYICKDCEAVWTWYKKAKHHEFPYHPACPECSGRNTRRKWNNSNVTFNVKKGKAGNAKDGYTGRSGKKQKKTKLNDTNENAQQQQEKSEEIIKEPIAEKKTVAKTSVNNINTETQNIQQSKPKPKTKSKTNKTQTKEENNATNIENE